VAARVDRLRCIGNGQVPAVVKLAWTILSGAQPHGLNKTAGIPCPCSKHGVCARGTGLPVKEQAE
jgi:hypothetical protein